MNTSYCNTNTRAQEGTIYVLMILLMLFNFSCEQKTKKETVSPKSSETRDYFKERPKVEDRAMMNSADSEKHGAYFPKGVFNIFKEGKEPFGDEIKRKEYTRIFQMLGEDTLFLNENHHCEVFRLLWQPSRGPITLIRFENCAGDVRILLKRLERQDRKGKNVEVMNVNDLSFETWLGFKSMIENSGFWDLSHTEIRMMLDGELLLLEGRTGNRYHLVERVGPSNDIFNSICYHLLCISKIEYGCQRIKEMGD